MATKKPINLKHMKKTIVIAENNDLLRWIMTYRLKLDGFEVKNFDNGKGASDYMLENHFDLLITDLQMPLMGGFNLIQTIRRNVSKTIPIMVLTNTGGEEIKIKILEMGANVYVAKPVMAGELSVRVKCLI